MKKVYLITGAPGSGKSYYVSQHIKENDIVFDLDEINKALGGSLHDGSNKTLSISLAMRDAAIDTIASRKGAWDNAYFITATPRKADIESLKRKLNAEEIPMNRSIDEVKENILRDDTRADKDKHIKLVDEWYKANSEPISKDEPYKRLLNDLLPTRYGGREAGA